MLPAPCFRFRGFLMEFNRSRLIIAAMRGGAGKTVISVGLAAAWKRHLGLRIVAFKKGPDYIDAGWLSAASGGPCYNLDPFLMSPEQIVRSFVMRSASADGSLIEGNRGLYDGVDANGSYSTAELAKLLRCPVVLIVDATKVTRTAAAMVLGCQRLDAEVNIAGVILNQVAGKRHEHGAQGIDRAVLRDSDPWGSSRGKPATFSPRGIWDWFRPRKPKTSRRPFRLLRPK